MAARRRSFEEELGDTLSGGAPSQDPGVGIGSGVSGADYVLRNPTGPTIGLHSDPARSGGQAGSPTGQAQNPYIDLNVGGIDLRLNRPAMAGAPNQPVTASAVENAQQQQQQQQQPGAGASRAWDEAAFRNGWLAYGGGVEGLRRYVDENGWGSHVQLIGSKSDKIRLPDGRVVDAVQAAGAGGQTPQWLVENGGREFDDPWGGALEDLVREYLGDTRQRAEQLAGQYRTRAEELRQPAYTSAEEQAIRARSFDQLERRRQETLKNERERVYARGFAPTSGLVAGAERSTNENFENVRGAIESNLVQSAIDETQRRRDAALQLEALATEALNGGDLGAIQATGLPLTLMNTRQNNALNLYNATGNPLNSIMAILAAGQGQQGVQNQNNQNNMAGLGYLIDLLFR
jgi:hypothetical protein